MKFQLLEQLNDGYDFNEDISIMKEIFGVSEEELFKLADINNIDTKENLDKLYNYCYNHDLYINDIKWQELRELFDNTSNQVLCHGSRTGIKGKLRVDLSVGNNDFGPGFYIGETMKQAGMFVADDDDSSIYLILFKPKGLKYTTFRVDTDWMLGVAYYRGTLGKYENNPRVQRIVNKVENADYVVAPIADNRMFELIDAFINKELTDKQTLYALSANYLGMQYVLKTEKCVNQCTILNRCYCY